MAADGSNLPRGGDNDGSYWLDLPVGRDRRREGQEGRPRQREGGRAPVQVKPMLGGMATDLAMWFFYPLNGPARARVLRGLTIPLGGMPASAPTSATGST